MRRTARRAGAAATAIVLGLAALVGTAGTATATTGLGVTVPMPEFDAVAFSPAGCKIEYVSDAHPSDDAKNGVPISAKVNAKTVCGHAVELLTLQLTIVDLTTGERFPHEEDTHGKEYVFNQGAFLPCKRTDVAHMYQGFALGTSTEDHKVYAQEKQGRAVPVDCAR